MLIRDKVEIYGGECELSKLKLKSVVVNVNCPTMTFMLEQTLATKPVLITKVPLKVNNTQDFRKSVK